MKQSEIVSEDRTVHQGLTSPFLNAIVEKIVMSPQIQSVGMELSAPKLEKVYVKVSYSEKRGSKDSKVKI